MMMLFQPFYVPFWKCRVDNDGLPLGGFKGSNQNTVSSLKIPLMQFGKFWGLIIEFLEMNFRTNKKSLVERWKHFKKIRYIQTILLVSKEYNIFLKITIFHNGKIAKSTLYNLFKASIIVPMKYRWCDQYSIRYLDSRHLNIDWHMPIRINGTDRLIQGLNATKILPT